MSTSLAALMIGNAVIAVTRCSKRFPDSAIGKMETKFLPWVVKHR